LYGKIINEGSTGHWESSTETQEFRSCRSSGVQVHQEAEETTLSFCNSCTPATPDS
jgi:hypothetical protein